MEFIISIKFNVQDRAKIAPLIAAEQDHVQELREQGILQAIYVSSDRSSVWIVMQSEAQEQVEESLKAFPLYPYMQAEITPLVKM